MDSAVNILYLVTGTVASLIACLYAAQRAIASIRARWQTDRDIHERLADHETRIRRLETRT